MIKTKRIITIFIMVLLILTALPLTALADTVRITDRNPNYQYFDYYSSSGWVELKTPKHLIRNSDPEVVAYCLEHTNDTPGSTYYNSTSTPFSYFSSRTYTGLLIILEYGYPYNTPSGLTADQARYATSNAIRFWLSEEGMPNQYSFTNLSGVDLNTLASTGSASGSKIKSNSKPGSLATLQYAIDLLKKARSQVRMPHTVNFSPSSTELTQSGDYYIANVSITLTNLRGGYTLNQSTLPTGSTVSGYTGNSGDTLTIKVPISAVSNGETITLTASGSDNRIPANLYWAVSNSDPNKQDLVYMGTSYKPVGSGVLNMTTPNMGYIEIIKIDADTSTKLQGAVFKVIDSNGNEVDRLTTDANGYDISIELSAGVYSLQEVTAPSGYLLDTTLYENIRVNADETTTLNITNEVPIGVIRISKTNGNISMGDYLLQGAEFTITNASGTVVETVTTDNQGKASSSELPLGTYTVKEITAPDGFILNLSTFTAELKYQNQNIAIVYDDVSVVEQPQTGQIRLTKTNSNTAMGNYSLAGAVFNVIDENDNVVTTLTTDENGLTTSEQLPLGAYRVVEITAPYGYVLNDTEFTADLSYGGQTVSVVYADIEIPQEPQKGTVKISKQDSETGENAQGDATLIGAVFEIYNTDGELMERLECNDERFAISGELSLGEYTIKEVQSPIGYLLNSTSYSVNIEYSNQDVEVNPLSYVISDDVIKGQIAITKIAEGPLAEWNTDNPKPPLEGVKFEIHLKSTNELVDTLVTDPEGKAASIELPYGIYTVTETKTVNGFMGCEAFEVAVSEDGKVYSYIVENEVYKSQVKIIKIDSNTGGIIAVAGTEFQIKDSNGDLIIQYISFPQEQVIDTFVTDDTGTLTLPEPLIYGTYTLHEISPPYGYWLSDEPIEFTVDGTDAEITIEFPNQLILKRIQILKTDERDESRPLAGAVFEVYKNNELIQTITTNEDGIAMSKYLRVGDYTVKEVKAPEGFILDDKALDFTISDDETSVYAATVTNSPTRVIITKTDMEDERLDGAYIEVYNQDEHLVYEGFTDENGEIEIYELPVGKYYFYESIAPSGYIKNEKIYEFEVFANGDVIGDITIKNEPTEVTLSKTDITNSIPITGAEFTILDNESNIVTSGKTDENGEVTITHLPIGTYTFIETYAPDGYILSTEELTFTIDEYGTVTGETTMTNCPTALEINKVIYETNEPLTGAGFKVKNFLGLLTVKFTLNDDGSYRYDKNGEITEIMVDENGKAIVYGLPIGNYWLEEATVPAGYYPTAPVKVTIDENNTLDFEQITMIPNSEFVKLGLDRERWLYPLAAVVVIFATSGIVFIKRKKKKGRK